MICFQVRGPEVLVQRVLLKRAERNQVNEKKKSFFVNIDNVHSVLFGLSLKSCAFHENGNIQEILDTPTHFSIL